MKVFRIIWNLTCKKSLFRLSIIENGTFANFPELSRLNLAENRLTTTFKKQYFASNEYLNEIWLGSNPWRCECDKKSHEFYKYITDPPARVIPHLFFF